VDVELATGRQQATFKEEGQWAQGMAFAPDGKTLVALSLRESGSLTSWDLATGQGKVVPDAHHQSIRCLAFSPDGQVVATGGRGGREGTPGPQGHTDSVLALAFTPDGRTLATGSDDKTVKLWDTATGQERLTLKGFKDAVRSLAFSPDGTLLAAGSWDGTVRVWRAATEPEALARKAPARQEPWEHSVSIGRSRQRRTAPCGIVQDRDTLPGHW
jgi:WD40 repeat protein